MVRLLIVIGLLLPLSVLAQEEPPLPAPAPPPVLEQPAPPAPPPAAAPEAPPSPEDELLAKAIAFYDRVQSAPPEVAAFLARNAWLGVVIYLIGRLSKVIIWLFLFLLIGSGGRRLLRPLLGAPLEQLPAPQVTGYSRDRLPATTVPPQRAALADGIAWLIALAIACEAVGLTWFGELWSSLIGLFLALLWMVFWLLLVGLIVWSLSERGRRLVLSLLGWFYLTRSASSPPQGHLFTLPDGRQGTIVSTDLLHSVLQPAEGGPPVTLPNADLMEQYYRWAARPQPAAAYGP